MLQQEDTKDIVEQMAQGIPLKRIAQSVEVTNLLLFLASDESSYCTGTEYIVDGGTLIA